MSWPPAVVGPGEGVVPEDQYFCFVRVELEVVVSHPVGYVVSVLEKLVLALAGSWVSETIS